MRDKPRDLLEERASANWRAWTGGSLTCLSGGDRRCKHRGYVLASICSCVLYVPLFWKEATSHEERWGWWDEVSASSTVPDSIHGKSLLQHLILACTNVPCSVFLLCFEQSQGWGLTTSLAVCSPSPQGSLWDFFLHRYPHRFTVCFQLKSLSLHGPKPILVISLCGLSYLSVFSIFAGLQEQEE